MVFGVPLEIWGHENRAGAVPFLVEELVKRGHQVLVETKAGVMSHYSDEMYENCGAVIVPSPEKLYSQSEFILKVRDPRPVEYDLIRPDHTIFAFFHFFNNLEMSRAMRKRGCTCFAYEMVRNNAGERILLNVDRQIAGQLAVQHGAYYMQTNKGGRGILLGDARGASPAKVTILGASSAGINAACYAVNCGAEVVLFDLNPEELKNAKPKLPDQVKTMIYQENTMKEIFPETDLLIAAIQEVSQKSTVVVSKKAVGLLPKGTVIVDLDIDNGGSVETANPTTQENPIYVIDDIIHYCVPNLAAMVPVSGSQALSSCLLPYFIKVAEQGLMEVLKTDDDFFRGLAIYEGRVIKRGLAKELGVTPYDFKENIG